MKDKILNTLGGSIKIKVEGKNINNFIHRLIKNNINIEKVIPISYKEAHLIVDYRELVKIQKIKTIYKVKVIKYYGRLRLLKRTKRDIFLLLSLLVGVLTIYILSNMIFKIEVIHSNKNIIKLVNEELYSNGIRKYHFVKSYSEVEKIKKKILKDNKDSIEWLEIIREGTKYTVRVEERIINKKEDSDKIYDIVASKNAVIKTIVANSGEKVKNINTYVKKGETIISSQITLPNSTTIEKSASGTITGEVWYTVRVEYPYIYNETLYTGNKKKVLVFNLLNKRISFFDFHKYRTFERNIKYIFNNNFIPFSLTYEDEYETKIINDTYTKETASRKAIEVAKEKLLDKYSTIIDINDIKIINEEDLSTKIVLDLFITCTEDITEYKEVLEE